MNHPRCDCHEYTQVSMKQSNVLFAGIMEIIRVLEILRLKRL